MKLPLLLSLLALGAHLAAAQAPARPASARPKTRTAVPASASAKASGPVALAGPAAEAGPTPPPDAERVAARANALTDNMRAALALTPQQTEKVRAINLSSVRSVEQARLRYRADPRKLQGYVETIGSSRLSALKDVLNPAQFDKYQRKREEKMGIPSAPASTGTPVPGLPSGE